VDHLMRAGAGGAGHASGPSLSEATRTSLLSDHAAAATFVLDADQRVLACNRAAQGLLGADEPALVGRPFEELLTRPCRSRFLDEVVQRLAAGEVEEIALDVIHAEGDRIAVVAAARPIDDAGLAPATAVVGLLRSSARRDHEREIALTRRRAAETNAHLAQLLTIARDLSRTRTVDEVEQRLEAHLELLGYEDPRLELRDEGAPPVAEGATDRQQRTLVGPDGPLAVLTATPPPGAPGDDETLTREAILDALLAATTQAIQRIRMVQQLRRQALTDDLTGLANRRSFDRTLQQLLEERRRHELPVTLLYLDLDGFKDVNDHLGHLAGDRALVDVADALRDAVRGYDTIARVGGDEFAVLTRELPDRRVAAELGERLVEAITCMRDGVPLGVSIGVVHLPAGAPDRTADELLRAGDAAMYRAKALPAGEPHVWLAD
jgi:diguanylate cyclase (GGDEF)-like protein/PAS domain S-box-containing protein